MWPAILAGAKAALPKLLPALGSSALQLGTNLFSSGQANKNAANASALAWERTQNAYKTRYQTTMQDMKKAGLNPILAAQGVGGAFPQASASQTYQAAPTDSPASSVKQLSEAQNIQEDTKKKKGERALNIKKGKTEIAKQAQLRAQKRVADKQELQLVAQTGVLLNQHEKINREITKIGADTDQTRALTKQLKINTQRLKLSLSRLKDISTVYESPVGLILTTIRETMGSIGALISGTKTIGDM